MLYLCRLCNFLSIVAAVVCLLAPACLTAQSLDLDAALIKAAYKGNRAAVEKLLTLGAHVDCKDPITGLTPLMYALGYRHIATAKALLAHGASLKATDRFQRTPLWYAASPGNHGEIKWLLAQGADAYDTQGHSLLAMRGQTARLNEAFFHCFAPIVNDRDYTSSIYPDVNTASLALYLGADPNARNAAGETPLMLLNNQMLFSAAAHGDYAAVQKLLTHGVPAETHASITGTPLMWALYGRYTALAKLLLAHGANLNATDSMHHTPLWYAIDSGDRSEFEWLMTLGADAFDNQGRSMLTMRGQTAKLTGVCFHCFPDPIAYDPPTGFLALYLGADPNAHDERGETLLMFLCEAGLSKGLLTSLLSKVKVDLNARDANGRTVLMYSLRDTYNSETSLELIRRGADIHAMTSDGTTPLICAAGYGNVKMVKALLAYGTKVNLSEGGFTPLMAATKATAGDSKHSFVIVRMLLDRGALVNARDAEGRSALAYAALDGLVETTKLLLERGADPSIRLNGGQTLIQKVRQTDSPKRFEVIALLKQAGAKE